MTVLGGIGFTSPWLLLALIALPILWFVLRAIPPAPVRRLFPGVALLLGLTDDETVSDRTPWWLLLLRMLAVAAIIVGLAGPVLNPDPDDQAQGDGPLLFVLDGSWAGSTSWSQKIETISAQLDHATRSSRPVAILSLTDPEPINFQTADAWQNRLAGLAPMPWQPTETTLTRVQEVLVDAGSFDTLWFGDTLDYAGRDALIKTLQSRGQVQAFQTAQTPLALAPSVFEDGAIQLTALRANPGPEQQITLQAQGRDPIGNAHILATLPATFTNGATEARAELSLPAELRARITRFDIAGQRSAGAVALSDDGLRRREVALISARDDREGLQLLEPLHYIEQALVPTADILTGNLSEVLPANPDVIVLADIVTLAPAEAEPLQQWIEDGGMLIRFAGPRIAASEISRREEDPFMPVRLRAGGRSVGGAMSWGAPKSLAAFREASPFFGLSIPDDVNVTAQVLAQPDPTLANRVIASLSDGTPLVTRKPVEQGQIVLFHVTATAEWSTLPLSGLFVEMMERLANSSAAASADLVAMEGTVWTPLQVLDGFGALRDAGTLPGVSGTDLITADANPLMPPGLYASGEQRLARNVITDDTKLLPATWPSDIPVRGMAVIPQQPLAGWLLSFAILLLLLDVIASLALSGRLLKRSNAPAAMLALFLLSPHGADAQNASDLSIIDATSEIVLAHVITGDKKLDEVARAGLKGLSDTLFFRTSVEPTDPVGVDLEQDELAYFPILYWPITPDQPVPSDVAYAKLNNYLRSGGMILFDTRDGDIPRTSGKGKNARKLQQLAAQLDIPPLETLPADHVLTRTFYLLQDFPGRYNNRNIWVEAAPPNAEKIEGMPFRNLNDGVTPVVIGGNDWASAWAVTDSGAPMFPVGRGVYGERQREIAYRFGVNLVMHVLTGNYKSDQVHVPALLDRLGQ